MVKNLVSIIIPAYNAEQYIERTLRSAMNQTYDNIEILVINDGSSDATQKIAEDLAAEDNRIKTCNVQNGGVARARNTGLSLAIGDFVAFLDADDLWHPIKIERQLACLNSMESDFVACYSLHRTIDAHDRVTGSSTREPVTGYMLARHLYARFVGNGSGLLVRTQVAREVGGFDPSLADAGIGGCEDLDFELKIASRYRMAGLPTYLVGYRSYPGNMSSNRQRMALSMLEVTRRHIEANPSLHSYARNMAYASSYHYCFYCMVEDGSIVKASKALIGLAALDFRRAGTTLISALRGATRKLLRHRVRADPKPLADFYTLAPDTFIPKTVPIEQRRIERLKTIDEMVWNADNDRIRRLPNPR